MACARDNGMVEASLRAEVPIIPQPEVKAGKGFTVLSITLAVLGFFLAGFERMRWFIC